MTRKTAPTTARAPILFATTAILFYLLGLATYPIWIHHEYPAVHALGGVCALLAASLLLMWALYRYSQARTVRNIGRLNADLQQDIERQKVRETELQEAIQDLQRFNVLAVGRESRILELKGEVNALLEQMHRQKRYQAGPVNNDSSN